MPRLSLMDQLMRMIGEPTKAERDAKKLNVKFDAQLFMQMCQLLHKQAPPHTPILVMEAAPSTDDTECEFLCYAKSSRKKNMKFEMTEVAEKDMHKLLVELRNSMVAQKQPHWKGMKLTVDVPNDKYQVDFKY